MKTGSKAGPLFLNAGRSQGWKSPAENLAEFKLIVYSISNILGDWASTTLILF
jgi:hypothetical protein